MERLRSRWNALTPRTRTLIVAGVSIVTTLLFLLLVFWVAFQVGTRSGLARAQRAAATAQAQRAALLPTPSPVAVGHGDRYPRTHVDPQPYPHADHHAGQRRGVGGTLLRARPGGVDHPRRTGLQPGAGSRAGAAAGPGAGIGVRACELFRAGADAVGRLRGAAHPGWCATAHGILARCDERRSPAGAAPHRRRGGARRPGCGLSAPGGRVSATAPWRSIPRAAITCCSSNGPRRGRTCPPTSSRSPCPAPHSPDVAQRRRSPLVVPGRRQPGGAAAGRMASSCPRSSSAACCRPIAPCARRAPCPPSSPSRRPSPGSGWRRAGALAWKPPGMLAQPT